MSLKPKPGFADRTRLRPEILPNRDVSRDEPVAIGVPLAKLIKRDLVETPEIVMIGGRHTVAAERFRRLRTILTNDPQNPAEVIVVTSGAPEEGKSTVAMNMALAFAAERNERTLLIDADLHRPTIGGWLRPEPQLGLSEVLGRGAAIDHAILQLNNSPLEVLPSGGQVANPTELLASELTRNLIPNLRQTYKRIIIDTPPIIAFTDADVVGALSDGVIIVARAGTTPVAVYERAVSAVTSAPVLGTIFNDTEPSFADSRVQYSEHYHNYYGKRKRS